MFTRRTILTSALALATAPGAALAKPFVSTRLTVTPRGAGPDVILIHGVNSSRNVWNATLPALAGHRAHLVQIAGFAGVAAGGNAKGPVVASLAAEIARYIAETGLRKPTVIGHSMGGTIALMLAARWPGRVGRLMVVDMLPQPAGLLGGTAAGLGPLAESLQRMFSTTPRGRENFAQLMRLFSPPGSNSDPDVTSRVLSELAAIDLTPELPRITAPSTIVYATPAPGASLTPAQVAQSYTAGYRPLRGAKLIAVPNSGHMVMLDQPTRFNAAVRQFLAR